MTAQKLEEGICFSAYSSGQLDVFQHLVGAVVKLLLRGDVAEQVDDECQKQDSDKMNTTMLK